MTDAYYELIDSNASGERFRATDLARGTWSATIQHGGPVSALLTRALERCEQRDDTRLSRVVIDLLGGVPVEGDLWVRAEVQRPGKQVELLGAQMLAHAAAPLPRPRAEAYDRNLKARDWDRNYVHSLQWLWLTEPLSEGPGESWISPTVDLVKGESMTRLQRLFAVADCANGIGSKLDITKWTFLNTDLAVHVFRVPDGDWIGIRAETSYGPDGIGTTIGTLFDEQGAVGAIQQSVLVRRRPGRA